jgi:4-hydroxy-2-oxoheptanedioate aldolase
MRNHVKVKLRRGQAAFGSIVSAIGSPAVIWMLAAAGFDFVYIDAEHSTFSLETIGQLVFAAHGAGIVPIVRPPAIEPHCMSRYLDAGALGVLVPHIETVEEVRLVLKACKYAPEGLRGVSSRQLQTDYRAMNNSKSLDEQVLVGIMVESQAAVGQVGELASVPGVDLVVVGLSDLAQDLGLGAHRDHRLVAERVERVIRTCSSIGVAVGLHAFDLPTALGWLERGIRMLSYASDVTMIVDTSEASLRDLRAWARRRGSSSQPETPLTDAATGPDR